MKVKHLTDENLIKDTKILVSKELKCLVAVLECLIEIETRKLFSDFKYRSMLDFLMSELGYSMPAACRRLKSSRLMKDFPYIGPKIESGSLTLTNLYKVSNYFRKEKVQDPNQKAFVLGLLENKSSIECDKLLLELTPRPLPDESIRHVSKDILQLKINITDETFKKLDDVKCLLACHLIGDEFFSTIADEARENIIRKRFKVTDRGRKTHSTTRVPSNYDKRKTYETAEKKACSNCGGFFYLQEDHIEPVARRGASTSDNLRLLCFHCNQRERIKSGL